MEGLSYEQEMEKRKAARAFKEKHQPLTVQ